MTWFTEWCRNLGLMVHNIQHPDSTTKVVERKVEEKKLSETVTLRRTTIDEIEVKKKE